MENGIFYNTISLDGDELKAAEMKNKSLDQRVMAIYKRIGEALTPFEVLACLEALGFRNPITSVRRAITDLTSAGELIKCDEMKPGAYGKPNHQWRVKTAA